MPTSTRSKMTFCHRSETGGNACNVLHVLLRVRYFYYVAFVHSLHHETIGRCGGVAIIDLWFRNVHFTHTLCVHSYSDLGFDAILRLLVLQCILQ